MDLFSEEMIANILPGDGTVNYLRRIFDASKSDYYLDRLLQHIDWKHDEAIIFGKLIITSRKAAWYGDDGFSYTYSNRTKKALPWTRDLLELKKIAEGASGSMYNSCLLNLYHHGGEGVGWHSDDEKALSPNAAIASLSFGAERKFSFKHKRTQQSVSVLLVHGSLLVMKGATQTNWLHCLPKSKKITKPRVNLTFRTMVSEL